MKLIELEIQNIRGIKKLKLNQDGKNLVIYGPNGSGKSTVVDAIDFLLTGKISRLTGEGTSGITLKEHGPHINNQPAEAIVKGKIKIPGFDEPVEITRCMEEPNKLQYDEEYSNLLEPIIQISRRGQYILTRKDILKYITASPNNRAEAIQALLNLSDIERIRKKLVKIRNKIERDFKASGKGLNTAENAILDTTQIDTFNNEKILKFANENRAVLKAEPISDLIQSKLRIGLKTPMEIPKKNVKEIMEIGEDIQSLEKILSNLNLQEIIEYIDELNNTIDELNQNAGAIQSLNKLKLTEIGLKLIDETSNCPLCDATWNKGELVKKFNQRIKLAIKTRKIRSKIESISSKLMNQIQHEISIIEKIENSSKSLKIDKKIPEFQNWLQKLRELADIFYNSLKNYTIILFTREKIKKILAPLNISENLQKLKSDVKKKTPKSTPEQISWDKLTRLDEDFKIYESVKIEFSSLKNSFERAELLVLSFQQAKDKILLGLYEDIRDKFVELYKTLHGNDEKHFTAKIEPNQAGLNFEVDFHGYGTHPPLALHSEGHQDSMGICLYLALVEKVNSNLIDLVILDDVVMSVDVDHRKGICTILKQYYPNIQFLITTHDKTWTNQLKSENVVGSKGIVELYNWNIESGPMRMDYKTGIWEPIEEDLSKNDIPSAAARLRRGLEQFFGTVCNDLHVPVIYRLDGKHELGSFLIPAMNEYRSLMEKSIKSAKSWEKKDLVLNLEEKDSTRSQIYKRTFVEQWAINVSVHYNNWANLSRKEFKLVVEAFQDLCLLFKCNTCGGLLYLATKKNRPDSIRCNCGGISWNLIKKKK